VIKSGTVFLRGLAARAHGDLRLHLLETSATAALLGALGGLSFDEYGFPAFGTWQQIALRTAACGFGWLGLGLLLSYLVREACRAYQCSVLLDGGLLYLALEHEPAEYLTALRQRGRFSPGNPAAGLSFAARMTRLLAGYPRLAGAIGYQPYPAGVRWLDLALTTLLGGLGLLLVYYLSVNLWPMVLREEHAPGWLRLAGAAVVLCYLGHAAVVQARRTGLFLALADILLEDQADGEARYAGR